MNSPELTPKESTTNTRTYPVGSTRTYPKGSPKNTRTYPAGDASSCCCPGSQGSRGSVRGAGHTPPPAGAGTPRAPRILGVLISDRYIGVSPVYRPAHSHNSMLSTFTLATCFVGLVVKARSGFPFPLATGFFQVQSYQ